MTRELELKKIADESEPPAGKAGAAGEAGTFDDLVFHKRPIDTSWSAPPTQPAINRFTLLRKHLFSLWGSFSPRLRYNRVTSHTAETGPSDA